MATNKKAEETAEEKTATLAEMQAQMAAMLAEAQAAKAEAQRMLDEAAKLTDGKVVSAERAARIEEDRLRGEEPVEVKLFKDNGKYKGDVLVCVNGERFLIKRGVRVEVPRYVALVLEESAKQDTATANLIESESSRYEAEAAALNI